MKSLFACSSDLLYSRTALVLCCDDVFYADVKFYDRKAPVSHIQKHFGPAEAQDAREKVANSV